MNDEADNNSDESEDEAQNMAGVPKLNAPVMMKGGLSVQKAALNNDPDEIQCRICLDECDSKKNPFLTPCKCTGSVRYIHLDCFKSWLVSKK